MAQVGLLFGGRSVEHRVSLNSARTVARGLTEAGHRVIPLGIAQDGCFLDRTASAQVLADPGIPAIPPLRVPVAPTLDHLIHAGATVVFPVVHGTWGEDGTLQGLCEMIDLPYVGPGVARRAAADGEGGEGVALAVLRLDQEPGDDLLAALRALPEVQSADRIDLT